MRSIRRRGWARAWRGVQRWRLFVNLRRDERQPRGQAEAGGERLEPRPAAATGLHDRALARAIGVRRRAADPNELGPADASARPPITRAALTTAAAANDATRPVALDLVRSLPRQLGGDHGAQLHVVLVQLLAAQRWAAAKRLQEERQNEDDDAHGETPMSMRAVSAQSGHRSTDASKPSTRQAPPGSNRDRTRSRGMEGGKLSTC